MPAWVPKRHLRLRILEMLQVQGTAADIQHVSHCNHEEETNSPVTLRKLCSCPSWVCRNDLSQLLEITSSYSSTWEETGSGGSPGHSSPVTPRPLWGASGEHMEKASGVMNIALGPKCHQPGLMVVPPQPPQAPGQWWPFLWSLLA